MMREDLFPCMLSLGALRELHVSAKQQGPQPAVADARPHHKVWAGLVLEITVLHASATKDPTENQPENSLSQVTVWTTLRCGSAREWPPGIAGGAGVMMEALRLF